MADNQQIIETSAGVAASKVVTYGGSFAGAVSAWFGSIDWGLWISISIAIAGLLMNWYFAKKKDKRDEIEHKAFLENLKIKGKCDVEQN